jgi:hypothetical protein
MKDIKIEQVDNGFILEWYDRTTHEDRKRIFATLETVVTFLTLEFFV